MSGRSDPDLIRRSSLASRAHTPIRNIATLQFTLMIIFCLSTTNIFFSPLVLYRRRQPTGLERASGNTAVRFVRCKKVLDSFTNALIFYGRFYFWLYSFSCLSKNVVSAGSNINDLPEFRLGVNQPSETTPSGISLILTHKQFFGPFVALSIVNICLRRSHREQLRENFFGDALLEELLSGQMCLSTLIAKARGINLKGRWCF